MDRRAGLVAGVVVSRPDAAAMELDDLLGQRQTDAGALVASRPCSRWKITKTLSAYSGSIPMPLSIDADLRQSDRARPPGPDQRAVLRAVELSPLPTG